jgi:hypothetical protein
MASKELMNDLLLSDLHKELYGFRPSQSTWARWSEMTDAALTAEYEEMIVDNDRKIDADRAAEKVVIAQYEARIAKMMADFSIDRATAIRWDIQAVGDEEEVERYGMSHYAWELGLPMGYFNETSTGGTL